MCLLRGESNRHRSGIELPRRNGVAVYMFVSGWVPQVCSLRMLTGRLKLLSVGCLVVAMLVLWQVWPLMKVAIHVNFPVIESPSKLSGLSGPGRNRILSRVSLVGLYRSVSRLK